MELRHLRYFIAVAEELNFTRAAMKLHMAQPPLSVQIKKLEVEVGAQLLLRQGRQVVLTEAGQVFLEQARQMRAAAQRSVTLARRAASGEVGHLTIGFNTVAEFKTFPKIIPEFKKRYPDVHLTFQSFETAQQLEALRRDDVDVGFVWLPVPSDEFDARVLMKASLIAVLPHAHRVASAHDISIQDLSNEPLVMFSRTLDPQTGHQIQDLFAQQNAMMNVVLELDSLLSILNFVAIGTGCALLPDYLRGVTREGVVYKPLRGTSLVKTMAIAKKKGVAGVAAKFYDFVTNNPEV